MSKTRENKGLTEMILEEKLKQLDSEQFQLVKKK